MIGLYLGAVALGLAWGWLAHHLHRPARKRRRSLAVLATVSAVVTLFFGWQLGGGIAATFAGAAVVGAMGYGAWWEEVTRRAARPSADQ